MLKIKGYNEGANITLINVIYHKPKKDMLTGKYGKGSLDIIYKDLDNGEKKIHHIKDPEYTYYMTNENVNTSYNRLYIEKENVHPVVCKYSDLKKDIADKTGNLNWFYENLRNGNAKENDRLFKDPRIFNADMNIEDYYRYEFSKTYRNDTFVPDKLYFDIEVDSIDMAGDFPQPGECPINAVSLVHEGTKTVYVLLLENDKNPQINELKNTPNLSKEIKDFVRENVGGWKNEKRFGLDEFEYKILFYDEEIKLIHDVFLIINTLKPDFALAWNIAFDLPYFIERIKVLGYSPEEIICHPDFKVKEAFYFVDYNAAKFEERGDYSQISSYTVYIDQLITFASIRKGQRQLSGFSLDYVGQKIAKVRKYDYSDITTNISKLPYLNYKIFAFYNIMDTIVQKCIEDKVNDINFIFSKSIMSNTRYSKVHRQTVYLVNIGIKEFWDMGLIMGCNINKSNEKEGFPGAYVADPLKVSDLPKKKINGNPIMVCNNLNDFDYKALYPSEIDENNMAPDTMIGKVILPNQLDPKENRFNNDYFDRSVWFIEDLNSNNRLDFCKRYFNLADYEEMYDDIIEFFNVVRNSVSPLILVDSITGNQIMCRKINNEHNREMIKPLPDNKLRTMVYNIERMPKYDN